MARRFNEYKGYLAEVFMSQVLLNNQNRRKKPFPGHFFNSDNDIALDPTLHYLHHRVSLGSGKDKEVDIIAAFGDGTWVCQSKWETTKPMGVGVVETLIGQTVVARARNAGYNQTKCLTGPRHKQGEINGRL